MAFNFLVVEDGPGDWRVEIDTMYFFAFKNEKDARLFREAMRIVEDSIEEIGISIPMDV